MPLPEALQKSCKQIIVISPNLGQRSRSQQLTFIWNVWTYCSEGIIVTQYYSCLIACSNMLLRHIFQVGLY